MHPAPPAEASRPLAAQTGTWGCREHTWELSASWHMPPGCSHFTAQNASIPEASDCHCVSLFKLDKIHTQKIRELGTGRGATLLKPATTRRKTRDGAITCSGIEASGPPAKLCAAIQCRRRALLPCIPTYSSESIPSCLPQKQVFV